MNTRMVAGSGERAQALANMDPHSPHARYYLAKVGRWAGDFHFELTQPERLRALPIYVRPSVHLMAWLSRHGELRMSTSVDASRLLTRGQVIHSTRMTYAGQKLYHSVETLTLHPDGLSFLMLGRQFSLPMPGQPAVWQAGGEVDAHEDRATYRIPWLGSEMVQRTQMTQAGLELVQETPFSRARALLKRIGPL